MKIDRLRTEAWTELRLACYRRDNYHCRKCKKDKVLSTLHAHHIIPYIKGGKDALATQRYHGKRLCDVFEKKLRKKIKNDLWGLYMDAVGCLPSAATQFAEEKIKEWENVV